MCAILVYDIISNVCYILMSKCIIVRSYTYTFKFAYICYKWFSVTLSYGSDF